MTQHELFCPCSLLHRSLLSCFWLSSAAMPGFSPVFPILSRNWNFLMLEASEWSCEQDCNESWWTTSLLQWCDIDEVCVLLLLAVVSCFRRHQQHKCILTSVSQYCGGVLHCSSSLFCKALLLASELPTFYGWLWLWAWILHRLAQ